ncbi:hypothetical protein ACFVW8_17670 [Streptomyces sp. NPDC058221]|uniref:hypothetical protein n=1 Tax=Streptomyces sp. NPDC058221 TaxID=3346388 RepID=UPI0036E85595
MSSDVVVKASWGPRPESPPRLAERWLATLGALGKLSDSVEVEWRWDVDGDDAGPPVPKDAEGFAAAVEAGGPEEDADILGWTAAAVGSWRSGGYVRARVRAGGSDEYTPFTAVLNLFPAAGGQPGPLADRLPEVLAALADVWDADTGLTYDRDLFNAVKSAYGLRNSHPRCGWAVFLSENRAALVPAGLAPRRIETAKGGLVLDFGRSTDLVLAAQRTLAEAGALKPLPVSGARPKW